MPSDPPEPFTVVELRQPRCALRFGVGACPATGDRPCHNTWWTCPVRSAYDGSGSIRWRLVPDGPGTAFDLADFADADHPATWGIPVPGLTVSGQRGNLNPAGVLEGRSPFGTRHTVTVSGTDIPWTDAVGDFYPDDRDPAPPRGLFALLQARDPYFAGWQIAVYDGYRGQALADMRRRLYLLDSLTGPDAGGAWQATGHDPLMGAAVDLRQFPEAIDARLAAAITAAATVVTVDTVDGARLQRGYGNAGVLYARIGDEILSYTGATETAPGVWTLAGVQRGQLGTTAADAARDAAFGRVGRYAGIEPWRALHDLMTVHGGLDPAAIDLDDWDEEGGTWLPTIRLTGTVAEPTDVQVLAGELCRDGMFFVWTDEAAMAARMMAVRPPRGQVPLLTRDAHIVAGSVQPRLDIQQVITRVFVHYGPRNPVRAGQTPADWQFVRGEIEAEAEQPGALGRARDLRIFSRWITSDIHAYLLCRLILGRYSGPQRFVTLRVAAKDRTITIGQVLDVDVDELTGPDRAAVDARWQVVGWEAIEPGVVYVLDLQTYELRSRFGNWMADGAPDYADATPEQRAIGAWWADDDGLVGGDPAYTFN